VCVVHYGADHAPMSIKVVETTALSAYAEPECHDAIKTLNAKRNKGQGFRPRP